MRDRAKSIFSGKELSVLKLLRDRRNNAQELSSAIEISELSKTSGINDHDEVLRALYLLEGRTLARPFPEGDFTSHVWEITDNGVQALRMLEL